MTSQLLERHGESRPQVSPGSESQPINADPAQHFFHIDGLRALSVLAVVAFHLSARWLPGGFAGVDVFFVISGFVVTNAMVRHAHETPLRFLGGFYARRLARIVPPLLVMLVVTGCLSVLFIPRYWLTSIGDGIGTQAFFGVSNVGLATTRESYYSARLGFVPYVHTWSLGVEEQFYLLAPLLLFLVMRLMKLHRPRPSWRRWPSVLVLVPLSVSLAYQRATQTSQPLVAFFSVGSRWWELSVGVCIALAFVHRPPVKPGNERHSVALRFVAVAEVIAILGIGASFALLRESRFPWPTAILPVGAAGLFIWATTWRQLNGVAPARFVPTAHPLAVAIGRRSYSLYLWHWVVIVFLRWTIGIETISKKTIAVLLSFALAEWSFRFVEPVFTKRRFLGRLGNWQRNVAILSVLPISAFGIGKLTHRSASLSLATVSRHPDRWVAQPHMTGFESSRKCDVAIRDTGWSVMHDPTSCRDDIALLGRTLFVVGDSHALHYRTALEQISAETGLTVHMIYSPGCPYVSLLSSSKCPDNNERVKAEVLKRAKPGDVVFLSSLRLFDVADLWADEWTPELEHRAVTKMALLGQPDTQQQLVKDAQQWIDPFTDRDLLVMMNLPLPVFRTSAMRCSDWFNRSNGVCAGGLSIERSFIEDYRSPIIDMIHQIELGNSRVSDWDPLPALCSKTECDAVQGDLPLSNDGDHIATQANVLLLPGLRTFLVRLFN